MQIVPDSKKQRMPQSYAMDIMRQYAIEMWLDEMYDISHWPDSDDRTSHLMDAAAMIRKFNETTDFDELKWLYFDMVLDGNRGSDIFEDILGLLVQ